MTAVPLRVLYIEDHPVNRAVMAAQFDEWPEMQLSLAVDGESGLQAVHRAPPDVLLLDLHLPGISGFDVFTALQAAPQTRQIPVIALTADDTDGCRARVARVGLRHLMFKPVDFAQLRRLIAELGAGARA